MTNLGKIFFTYIFLVTTLSAQLSVSVDTTDVTIGERVTLHIVVSGKDAMAPQLSSICGENIISTSSSTSVQGINGVFTKKQTFEYVFIPTTSCTIEPITVQIDGKDEVSESIDLTVSPMKVTKNSRFILELETDKKKIHVGEPFKLTVVFRQKHNSNAVDSKFALPELKNFWIKEEAQSRKFEEDGYIVQRLSYIVAAQKSGYHTISPARIEIAARTQKQDSWGQWFATLKWRTYFSNDIEVEVLPLPQNVSVVGTFKIEATANTTEVNASEAVNVTVKISGSGNFEDIKGFKPKLKGVGVFDEEPSTKALIEQGQYRGVWSQKIAYVPMHDITIEPFELEYFDLKSNSVKTIQTEPIQIHVNNAAPVTKEPLKIQRAEVKEVIAEAEADSSDGSFVFGLIFGAVIGFLLGMLPWRKWIGRDDSVKTSYKNERDVLTLLLNNLDDDEASKMASQLEAKLYDGKDVIIDKKMLKQLYKKYS